MYVCAVSASKEWRRPMSRRVREYFMDARGCESVPKRQLSEEEESKQATKRISHYTDETMSHLPHLVLLLLLLQGAAVKALFLERLLLGPFAPDVCPGRCMLCTSCWILGGAVLPESPIAKYNSLRRSCFPYNGESF